MSKDKLNIGTNYDNAKSGIPNLDLNVSIGGKRSPAQRAKETAKYTAKGLGAGAAAGLKSAIAKEIPGAREAMDVITKNITEVTSEKENFMAELNPLVNALTQDISSSLPAARKIIPPTLYKILSEKLKVKEAIQKREQADIKLGAENQQIAKVLGTIFNKDNAIKKEELLAASSDRLYDLTTNKLRFQKKISLFSKMYGQLGYQSTFISTTFSAFLKKKLEIDYKQLYTSRDILSAVSNIMKINDVKLEEIKHNTSLPEMSKITSYELLKRNLSEGAAQKVANKVRTYGGKVVSNLKKTLGSKVKAGLIGASGMLQNVGMASSISSGLGDSDTAMNVGAQEGASMIGKFFASKKGKQLLKKNQGVKAFLEDETQSIPNRIRMQLNTLRDKLQEGGTLKKTLASFLVNPEDHKTTMVKKDLFTTGKEATTFDIATRQTIVEVIPAYLAKIAKNTKDIFTGKETEEEVYNTIDRKFSTAKNLRKGILKKSFGSKKKRKRGLSSAIGLMKQTFIHNKGEKEGAESFDEVESEIKKILINLALRGDGFRPFEFSAYLTDENHSSKYLDNALAGVKNPRRVVELIMSNFQGGNKAQNKEIKNKLDNKIKYLQDFENFKDKLPVFLDEMGYGRYFGDILGKKGELGKRGLRNLYSKDKTKENAKDSEKTKAGVDNVFERNKEENVSKSKSAYLKTTESIDKYFNSPENIAARKAKTEKRNAAFQKKKDELTEKLKNVANPFRKKKESVEKNNTSEGVKKNVPKDEKVTPKGIKNNTPEEKIEKERIENLIKKRKQENKKNRDDIDEMKRKSVARPRDVNEDGVAIEEPKHGMIKAKQDVGKSTFSKVGSIMDNLLELAVIRNSILKQIMEITGTTIMGDDKVPDSAKKTISKNMKKTAKASEGSGKLKKYALIAGGVGLGSVAIGVAGAGIGAGLAAAGPALGLGAAGLGLGAAAYLSTKLTLGLGKGISKVFKRSAPPKQNYVNVYLLDKISPGNPLLSIRKQQNGVIFENGDVVKTSEEITEPVFDPESRECIITQEDLKHGIVGGDNLPLGVTSKTSTEGAPGKKGKGKGFGAIKGLFSTGKGIASFMGKGALGYLDVLTATLGLGAAGVKGLFGLFKKKEKTNTKWESKVIKKMDAIISRMKKPRKKGDVDDDGDRDNSVRDYFSKKKEKASKVKGFDWLNPKVPKKGKKDNKGKKKTAEEAGGLMGKVKAAAYAKYLLPVLTAVVPMVIPIALAAIGIGAGAIAFWQLTKKLHENITEEAQKNTKENMEKLEKEFLNNHERYAGPEGNKKRLVDSMISIKKSNNEKFDIDKYREEHANKTIAELRDDAKAMKKAETDMSSGWAFGRGGGSASLYVEKRQQPHTETINRGLKITDPNIVTNAINSPLAVVKIDKKLDKLKNLGVWDDDIESIKNAKNEKDKRRRYMKVIKSYGLTDKDISNSPTTGIKNPMVRMNTPIISKDTFKSKIVSKKDKAEKNDFVELAKTPAAVKEAGLAQVVATEQLGIKLDSMVDYLKSIADSGRSTIKGLKNIKPGDTITNVMASKGTRNIETIVPLLNSEVKAYS